MKKTILCSLTAFLFSSPLLAQTAPGGITEDLNYWLKADAGVTLSNGLVSQWNNQTSTGGNINQTNNNLRPSFTSNALNFNPAISFSTALRSEDFLNTDELVWDSDTVIVVFNPSQSLGNNVTLQAVLVYNIPNNTFGDAGIGIGTIAGNGNFFNSTDITPAQSGEYIAESRVSPNNTADPVLAVVRQNTVLNPTQSQHRFWGEDTNINITNLSQYASHQNTEFTIGQRDGGGLPFDGDVLEAISYSSRLDDVSLRRIESYLSIKYGLTLNQRTGQDYVSSSANTIYDADGVLAGFVSNIAGIGRDDASGLNQKQSTSTTTNSVQANNNGLVTIGLGTIAETNALNTNNFAADQTFMLWGNNAASTNFNTSFTNASTSFTRMQRIWAIQETGNVGTVRLTIPQSLFDNDLAPSLVISTNTTIGSADTVIPLSDDGNNNYTARVNFRNGDFFTFAQSESDSSDEAELFITPLPSGGAVIFGL